MAGILLTCADRHMSWCEIGTRPSPTFTLTRLRLAPKMRYVEQRSHGKESGLLSCNKQHLISTSHHSSLHEDTRACHTEPYWVIIHHPSHINTVNNRLVEPCLQWDTFWLPARLKVEIWQKMLVHLYVSKTKLSTARVKYLVVQSSGQWLWSVASPLRWPNGALYMAKTV